MQKTYTLAIERAFTIQPIVGLPLMTLKEAQHWQSIAAMANKPCLVINTKAQ
ncbi:hypothetical protein UFOVP3_58 [uncultured Caudovirales phage]|uniref:Uncharacterized protein n=1 Tax=uncultured Caudovirales phage TaxID=2100421 RepID=A0A6J5T8X7_9CAUD|nr:hypothetical protein UFOVP3_58 [uncultured Caudovirales phage]